MPSKLFNHSNQKEITTSKIYDHHFARKVPVTIFWDLFKRRSYNAWYIRRHKQDSSIPSVRLLNKLTKCYWTTLVLQLRFRRKKKILRKYQHRGQNVKIKVDMTKNNLCVRWLKKTNIMLLNNTLRNRRTRVFV